VTALRHLFPYPKAVSPAPLSSVSHNSKWGLWFACSASELGASDQARERTGVKGDAMDNRQCCEFDMLSQAFTELKYSETRAPALLHPVQPRDDRTSFDQQWREHTSLRPAAAGKEDLLRLSCDSHVGETTARQGHSGERHGWLLVRATAKFDADGQIISWQEERADALARCKGLIAGPAGAAALLQVPRQTLESKIATLGVDKDYFKTHMATHNPRVH
jgi:hypothetical protein